MFKDLVPTGDDVREGLTAIISMRVPHPQFEGQTKTKLGNGEVEGIVNTAVGDGLAKYLEENPKIAKVIVKRASWRPKLARAARKAKALCANAKAACPAAGCPASFAIAPAATSTGASCIWSRAIRPAAAPKGAGCANIRPSCRLRGKIINAYKSREDKVLANEEVRSMISAIGAGIGEEADIAKRRYNKIVIMTDADVDGSHIRTLLLTFFYRQMYDLVSKAATSMSPSRRCFA